MNNSIHSVIERLSKDVPGSYSYVFDSSEGRFIFKSQLNEELEAAVVKLDKDKGLSNLVSDSPANLVQLDCKDTKRKFLIKKLAADIFFGMCVEQSEEIIAKAKQAMTSSFK